jgi:c-di-AMP phosphodiesterase-like protein
MVKNWFLALEAINQDRRQSRKEAKLTLTIDPGEGRSAGRAQQAIQYSKILLDPALLRGGGVLEFIIVVV